MPSPPGRGSSYTCPLNVTRSPRIAWRTIATRLAHASQRAVEPDAVPALDHLRAADAQPEDEAAAGHRGQAHGRHRQERGRSRARLHDPRAETDSRRAGGHEGQRGGSVEAPRLVRPDEVDAEALGLDDIVGRLAPVVVDFQPQPDGDAHHAGLAAARAEAIFCSWPAWSRSWRRMNRSASRQLSGPKKGCSTVPSSRP